MWVISDTHFGHAGVCKFLNSDGTKLRPWDNPDEMDETLISNWNSVVRTKDRVYHLGDVVINRRCLSTLARLNGRKVLVKGNHDIFRLKDYTEYFEDIRSYVVGKGYILTHMPIHPSCLGRFGVNIHGHLHNNSLDDPRYFNVSVERINYTPVNLGEIVENLRNKYDSEQVD